MTVAQIVTFGVIVIVVAAVVVVAVLVSRAGRSGAGESCAGRKCAADLVCGSDQRCRAPPGTSCRADADCESGRCTQGRCQVPLVQPPPLRPTPVAAPRPVATPSVSRPVAAAPTGPGPFCAPGDSCPPGTQCRAGLYSRLLRGNSPGWQPYAQPSSLTFDRLAAVGPWLAGLGQGQIRVWSGTAWNDVPTPRNGSLGLNGNYRPIDLAADQNDLYVLYRGERGDVESKRNQTGYAMVRFRRTAQSGGGWRLDPSPVSFDLEGAPISIDAAGGRSLVLSDQGRVYQGGSGFSGLRQVATSTTEHLQLARLGPGSSIYLTATSAHGPRLMRIDGGEAKMVALLSGATDVPALSLAAGQMVAVVSTGRMARLTVLDSGGGSNTFSDSFGPNLLAVSLGDQLIIQAARCEPT